MRTHILLETNTASDAKHLINFLKTLPHIKSVTVEPALPKPLTAAEWALPGRPATDEEIEKMLDECEAEKGGYSTVELKKRMRKWKAKQPV